MEKQLTNDELRHYAVRCLKQVIDRLDQIDSGDYPTLKDKVAYMAGQIGFKPGNCEKIANRAMDL